MDTPRNRKQRRADSSDPFSIPLAHPTRDNARKDRNAKTLVDIIAEKKGSILNGADANGDPGTRFVTVDPSSGEISGFDPSSLPSDSRMEEVVEEDGENNASGANEKAKNEPLPPFLDTILLSTPLTTLHLTLAYLAAHQYAAEIPLSNLLRESAFVAFPVLTLLIHLAHGHVISLGAFAANTDDDDDDNDDGISLFPLTREKLSFAFLRRLLFPPSARTLVFLVLSVILGVKLMNITNEAPYYAVMKRAPAVGTIWVWSILEVPVGAAVVGALGPLGWGVWWRGYGLF